MNTQLPLLPDPVYKQTSTFLILASICEHRTYLESDDNDLGWGTPKTETRTTDEIVGVVDEESDFPFVTKLFDMKIREKPRPQWSVKSVSYTIREIRKYEEGA